MSDCDDIPIDLWEKYQFVLVTVTLGGMNYQPFTDAKVLARQLLRPPPHFDNLCLIGTKLDIIPKDYSPLDLFTRDVACEIAYYHNLRFFSVSSTTGENIEDVCYFIGTLNESAFKLCLINSIAGKVHPLPSHRTFTSNLWHTWSRILDKVASVFALPTPVNANQEVENFTFSKDCILMLSNYRRPTCLNLMTWRLTH